MEIWKFIPDSTYEASSLGRIRSPRGRILKPQPHPLGYQIVQVQLGERKKCRTLTVHSLVALAFHGPRPEGLDVAHGNCVKTDNRPSNLRYATRSENMQDTVMMGQKFGFSYPWDLLEIGQTFESNPITRAGIQSCISHARKRTGRDFIIARAANDNGSWTVTRVA